MQKKWIGIFLRNRCIREEKRAIFQFQFDSYKFNLAMKWKQEMNRIQNECENFHQFSMWLSGANGQLSVKHTIFSSIQAKFMRLKHFGGKKMLAHFSQINQTTEKNRGGSQKVQTKTLNWRWAKNEKIRRIAKLYMQLRKKNDIQLAIVAFGQLFHTTQIGQESFHLQATDAFPKINSFLFWLLVL